MLTLSLEIEVRRADGTTRYKEKQAVNSWVKQAAQIFESACKMANVQINDTGGGQTGHNPAVGDATFRTPIGSATGIQVGTGSTAVDKDDTILETEIANGGGSLQMNRDVHVNYEGVLGTTTGYTVLTERTFNNDSGTSITINEVGVYFLSTGAVELMGVRDVLAVGVVVLDNESVVVRYFTDWDV